MALISEAKRQANRRNAQRSTGPRTAEGKQAVRFNAVKHGLTALTSVLPQEDGEEFAALVANLEARFAPQDEAERDVVRDLADAIWRKRRGGRFEALVLQALIAKEEADELTSEDVTIFRRCCSRSAATKASSTAPGTGRSPVCACCA